uniref:Uncharacterized protein n=1 Tax=Anopheles albimanus TaxID=7167 RepID=A0A182FWZ1_ANOAL
MKFTFALFAVVALLVAAVSCQDDDVERQWAAIGKLIPNIFRGGSKLPNVAKVIEGVGDAVQIGQTVACLLPGTDIPC